MSTVLVITEKSTQVTAFKNFIPTRLVEDVTIGEHEGIEIIFCPLQGHVFETTLEGLNMLNFVPPSKIIPVVPVLDNYKGKIHQRIKKIKKQYWDDIDTIILATDPDKEGCAIAKETVDYYKLYSMAEIIYMDIHNTSAKALEKAFNKVLYQKKNHIDWERWAYASMLKRDFNLTGLAITNTINDFFKIHHNGFFITFGTQQTRALNLLVQRYKAHIDFDRSNHYRIRVTTEKGIFIFNPDDTVDTKNQDTIRAIANTLKEDKSLKVTDVNVNTQSNHSPLWYDGSQVGSIISKKTKKSIAHIFGSKTSVMQKMYESGDITYIRGEAKGKMAIGDLAEHQEIARELSTHYHCPQFDTDIVKPYLWREEDSKEQINHTPCTVARVLDPTKFTGIEKEIIDMMAKMILSAFSPDNKTNNYIIIANGAGYEFKLEDIEDVELGFREIYKAKKRVLSNELTKEISENEILKIKKIEIEEYKKTPPALFTEGSFVETLKKKSIGSESTFSSYLDIMLDRQKNMTTGKNIIRGFAKLVKGKLIPTEKGINLIETLSQEDLVFLNKLDEEVISLYLDNKLDEEEAIEIKNSLSMKLYQNVVSKFKKNADKLAMSKQGGYEKVEAIKVKNISCPKCKGTLFVKSNIYKCEHNKQKKTDKGWEDIGTCKFVLFAKSKKGAIYTISEQELEELFSKTIIKKKITWEKTLKEVTADIKLTEDYRIEILQ